MYETQIRNLMEKRSTLSAKDKEFSDSLLDQLKKKGSLSDKQWYWVGILADRAVSGPPVPKVANLGDFSKVFGLFEVAKKHLKYPKIIFGLEDVTVQLAVAGPRSKYNGQVTVTDGGPYMANQWWGAIERNGVWTQPLHKPVPTPVVTIIKALAADPAKAASEYGYLSGACCFCNSKLTDERSIFVGYGPVCSKHFGLPWGGNKAVIRKETFKSTETPPEVDRQSKWVEAAYGARKIHRAA